MRLKDQVAIVTGGGGGIGEGICMCLAREGAQVAVCDIDRELAGKVAARIETAGGKALAVKTDVRSPEECKSLIDTTRYICLNAGSVV